MPFKFERRKIMANNIKSLNYKKISTNLKYIALIGTALTAPVTFAATNNDANTSQVALMMLNIT